jgi:uncharacterized protein (TIGR03067 family)
MKARVLGVLALAMLFAADAAARDKPPSKEEEARKDLLDLQGTWQLESVTDARGAKLDLKKRTLFVGGELFLVRDGDKMIQAGVLRLVPTRSPRLIDVVVRKGKNEDNTMLGIYELKGDCLKLCFDPEGETRPRAFAVKADTKQVLATYKRVKGANEAIDIRGKYRCESAGGDGKKQILDAEVQKRGDAYLVRWSLSGNPVYIGTGIRRGDTLSVAWANRGTIGISVYKIEKGPKLVGVYTEVGGAGLVSSEVLTAGKAGTVAEVRLR